MFSLHLFSMLSLSFFSIASAANLAVRQSSSTATGNTQCTTYMCISAVVNGSTTTWSLQSKSQSVGWLAMGFGSTMAKSPMVIMWPNADGSITLSQREAPAEVMPTVVADPQNLATLSNELSIASGSKPTFVYTVPTTSTSSIPIIWAFGSDTPSSSAVDATFQQHVGFGTLTMDLSTPSSSGSGSPGSSSGSSGSGATSPSTSTSTVVPLLPYERLIIVHAIFCTLGFLLLLPSGVLLARYFRTIAPTWFAGHWIAQAGLAGPIIIVGVALGIASVSSAGGIHLNDVHKRWGVGLFALYFIQCALGAVIHWVKPKNAKRRPAQNYMHAVLGLIIIGLAFYQVRTGYNVEWMMATGRVVSFKAANIVWYIWIFLLPILYTVGLSLLPRQFRQERAKRMPDEYGMGLASKYVSHGL